MPRLTDYGIMPLQEDEELNPVPLTMGDYMAVQPTAPSPHLQKYLDLAGQAAADEQAGVSQLQQYIDAYKAKPQEIDLTPLAAFADTLTSKPGHTAELMKMYAPESEADKTEKIMKLQDLLQQRRQGLTKTQMEFLNAQLKQEAQAASRAQEMARLKEQFAQKQQMQQDKMAFDQQLAKDKLAQEQLRTQSYQESNQIRKDIAQMQLDAAKATKDAAQDRADERQKAGLDQKKEFKLQDQVVKLSKEFSGELPATAGDIKNIEDILGHNLDTYDSKTESFSGEKVDAPGISVPLIGRVSLMGTKAEDFSSSFNGIFNKLLKQRSGAAVTNPELSRLRSEFAAGLFNTEEKMITALHRYKKALRKTLLQHEKAVPEAAERFRAQGGLLTEDLLGMEPPPPPPERKKHNGKIFEKESDGGWVEVLQ